MSQDRPHRRRHRRQLRHRRGHRPRPGRGRLPRRARGPPRSTAAPRSPPRSTAPRCAWTSPTPSRWPPSPRPCPELALLVNNAGGAKGLEPVAQADEDDWRWMFETNVIGTLRMTKALLPALLASGDGHIVTVTSIAALETYDNGAGYTAAKHAQAMLHRTLRGELLGQPVRLTEILPGMVETDFSLVRFDGDADRAAAGLPRDHPADRGRRGRGDRVRGHPAQPRQPGPDRAQTARPGQRHPRPPPPRPEPRVTGPTARSTGPSSASSPRCRRPARTARPGCR